MAKTFQNQQRYRRALLSFRFAQIKYRLSAGVLVLFVAEVAIVMVVVRKMLIAEFRLKKEDYSEYLNDSDDVQELRKMQRVFQK